MPTRVGPNTFGEENLVFGYDLGDTVNSYKGEPTVNYAVTDMTAFTSDNGCTVTATGELFQGQPVYRVYFPAGTLPRIRFNFAYTTGQQWNGSIYYKVVQSGDYMPQFFFRESGFGSSYTSTTFNTDGTWRRANLNYTFSSNGTSMFLLYRSNGASTQPVYIDFAMPQVELNSHATPFTAGTRSATQGLIDLTGNSTINLTNVSFDSNAQMTFDGTDDKIHGIPTVLSYLSSSAFEFVVTPESTSKRMMVGGYRHNQGYSSPTIGAVYIDTDNKFKASVITTAEVYRYAESTTTTSANQTYHVVFNKDTITGVMQLYINGVAEGAQTFNAATYGQWSSAGSYIGSNNLDFGKSFNTDSGQGWSGDFLDGKIHSIKLYSRTLTAQEVRSNFNAIKSRFNI